MYIFFIYKIINVAHEQIRIQYYYNKQSTQQKLIKALLNIFQKPSFSQYLKLSHYYKLQSITVIQKILNTSMLTKIIEPRIQNVVSSARIAPITPQDNWSLQLSKVKQSLPGCGYVQKPFPVIILKRTKPRSTILIFQSGKIVICGCQSLSNSELTAEKVVKEIKKATKMKIKLEGFRISNVVSRAFLGHKLNLNELLKRDNCSQKVNNKMQTVLYRFQDSRVIAMIDPSGWTVLSGGRSQQQTEEAFNQLLEIMTPYQI